MVCVSASVNLPSHHKVQKFSPGTGSPGRSRKRAVKRLWCGGVEVCWALNSGRDISGVSILHAVKFLRNSDNFEVKAGMHQGSALSPLLLVIMLEAISREFRDALP